jgi:hypothetical protein
MGPGLQGYNWVPTPSTLREQSRAVQLTIVCWRANAGCVRVL